MAVYILTSKAANRWYGYNVIDTLVWTWTADQLLDEDLDAWLLYNAKHESLPASADHFCPWNEDRTFCVKM